jgi:YesN/AraC family two-component response regulator
VITDLAMPHVTGRQLARAMRRTVPDQRIILVTGFEQEHTASDGPAEAYLTLRKPVSQNGLRLALSRVMKPDDNLAENTKPAREMNGRPALCTG